MQRTTCRGEDRPTEGREETEDGIERLQGIRKLAPQNRKDDRRGGPVEETKSRVYVCPNMCRWQDCTCKESTRLHLDRHLQERRARQNSAAPAKRQRSRLADIMNAFEQGHPHPQTAVVYSDRGKKKRCALAEGVGDTHKHTHMVNKNDTETDKEDHAGKSNQTVHRRRR